MTEDRIKEVQLYMKVHIWNFFVQFDTSHAYYLVIFHIDAKFQLHLHILQDAFNRKQIRAKNYYNSAHLLQSCVIFCLMLI